MKNASKSKKGFIVLPIAVLLAVAAAFLTLLCFSRGWGNQKPVSVYSDSEGHRIALYKNGETRDLGTDAPVTTRPLTSDALTSAPVTTAPVTSAKDVKTYTVTFLDYSGVWLGQCVVEKGGTAVPPPDPVREGYVFTGWSGQLFNITSSKTVTAKYTQIDRTNVFDLSCSVSGEKLYVNLKIDGKVSIAGAEGVLKLPDGVAPSEIVPGSGVYAKSAGQNVYFVFASPSGKNQTSDREILSLTFDGVSGLPDELIFPLTIGDAFDQNFESVSFSVIGQSVFVRK